MSFPTVAEMVEKMLPANCIPSPESPEKRTITWSNFCVLFVSAITMVFYSFYYFSQISQTFVKWKNIFAITLHLNIKILHKYTILCGVNVYVCRNIDNYRNLSILNSAKSCRLAAIAKFRISWCCIVPIGGALRHRGGSFGPRAFRIPTGHQACSAPLQSRGFRVLL